MSDSESDIEMKSALPNIIRKPPPSPTDLRTKKITTKMMIVDALTECQTRKGVSLYAIKKFLTEKYDVNTEKVNYLIKKSIRAGVEDGTFVQMKGIGASGSFKLAKPKPKKKEKTEKEKKKTEKTVKKNEKSVDKKEKKTNKKEEKVQKKVKETEKEKPKKVTEKEKPKKVEVDKEKGKKPKKNDEAKKKVKSAKGMKTPAKKRAAMIKRKSIGSIIKPPKMKPQLQA